jgi:WD40 repeat protein/serine/threonine protein kinase
METQPPGRETVEQLAEEFAERYKRGERPLLSEYAARYPEHAEAIRDLFPAVIMMEKIARDNKSEEFISTNPSPHKQLVALPERLGEYRILREIGRGGMGIVYEAEQESLGRRVALKVLPPHFRPNPIQRQRFEREARAAARLHHTNIVPVFGVGEEGGLHYYVMQYIQGLGLEAVIEELRRLRPGTRPSISTPVSGATVGLRNDISAEAVPRSLLMGAFDRQDGSVERIPEPGTVGGGIPVTSGTPGHGGTTAAAAPSAGAIVLPGQGGDGRSARAWTYWHSVAHIGSQVAEALAYAHQEGVLHRDIKPANLLLDTRGNVWVTDFGLAKLDDQDALTNTGDVIGTARYLAPEMLDGKADARSDVYALGLTLYELLAFRPAFVESDRFRLARQILSGVPDRLERVNPEIPRDLATIVHKAIDCDPGGRYQTARQLAQDLHCFLEDRPIKARRPWLSERIIRWSRRNKGLAAALAAIAALLVIGTVASGLAAVYFLWLAREAARGRLRAEQAMEGERWERYRSNIAAAASALQLQNIGPARLALDEAPEEYRNWEWRHLHSQLEGARLILPVPITQLETPFLVASPVGSDVAVAYRDDARIGVWDTTTGTERVRWSGPETPREVFAYSPDGKRLATGSEHHAIHLWDTATGKLLTRLAAHQGAVWSVTFSPDARRIISSSKDGTFRLWDATTGQSLAVLGSNAGERRLPALFSPDGTWIATACGKDIRLWGGETGRPLGLLGSHDHPITRLAILGDGRRVASVARDETVVVLWDRATRTRAATLTGHTGLNLWFVVSPVGSRMISADLDFRDPAPRLWDATTGRLIRVMAGHTNIVEPRSIAFSPDGTRIVSGSLDQSAFSWDGLTGERIADLRGHSGMLLGVRFSPDGKLVVTIADDQTLRLWQARTGALLSVLRGHSGRVKGAVFTATGELVSASTDDTLRVWDLDPARDGVLRGHESYVYDAAFNGDGSIVASAAWDHTARLWDARTGRQLGGPLVHEYPIATSLAFSPDGRRLAVVTRDDRIHVWDVAGRRRLHVLSGPTGVSVGHCRVAFSPDGTLLAGGACDGRVRLWDATTGEPAGVLQAPEPHIYDLAFSPDGRQLATAGAHGPVRLWDVATRRSAGELPGSTETVPRVAYSGDGRLIAWVTGNIVKVADTGTRRELASLYNGSMVFGMAFSPDRTRLAVACKDNTIRLWDLSSYRQVVELRGHTDYVSAVAFSPDGTQLVSGSGDSTVRIWDTLPPPQRAHLARIQARTGDRPADRTD